MGLHMVNMEAIGNRSQIVKLLKKGEPFFALVPKLVCEPRTSTSPTSYAELHSLSGTIYPFSDHEVTTEKMGAWSFNECHLLLAFLVIKH